MCKKPNCEPRSLRLAVQAFARRFGEGPCEVLLHKEAKGKILAARGKQGLNGGKNILVFGPPNFEADVDDHVRFLKAHSTIRQRYCAGTLPECLCWEKIEKSTRK